MNKLLFKQIDNSALIVFRICFGLLITLEAWSAIFSGWVDYVMVEPQFTFNFIGFDFLQPLPENWMYAYYIVMGVFGIFVMIGYRYKVSMTTFTLMWTCVYLMHKTYYNNHYYLLILVCIFMCLAPAHRNFSVDTLRKPSLKRISMPQWVWLFLVLQVAIVYFFGAIAKLYPGWLDGTVAHIILENWSEYPIVGTLVPQEWSVTFMVYFAFLFDLLIIPLLLWKKTRVPAFLVAVFFHLFNSFLFQIGIFPYLSLAFCLFFFTSKTINKRFLPQKPYYSGNEIIVPNYKKTLIAFLALWFLVQISLPLRHWFIEDNVLWTEEGHRLSWRMMLRSKSGKSRIKIINKEKGRAFMVDLDEYLTEGQIRAVSSKPDILWQFCQRLEAEYARKGQEIAIYVDCWISVNGGPYLRLIDPEVDMANAEWDYFFHNEWILPSKLEE